MLRRILPIFKNLFMEHRRATLCLNYSIYIVKRQFSDLYLRVKNGTCYPLLLV